MKLFMVAVRWYYEGEDVIGVFSSYEKATEVKNNITWGDETILYEIEVDTIRKEHWLGD